MRRSRNMLGTLPEDLHEVVVDAGQTRLHPRSRSSRDMRDDENARELA